MYDDDPVVEAETFDQLAGLAIRRFEALDRVDTHGTRFHAEPRENDVGTRADVDDRLSLDKPVDRNPVGVVAALVVGHRVIHQRVVQPYSPIEGQSSGSAAVGTT